MFKNKKAFTLAEVLITLGIIGVVAALSAPALIQHAANAKIGPALSRGMSVVAQGLQAYMFDNDSDTVIGADATISKDPTALFRELAESYTKMKEGGIDLKEISNNSTGGGGIGAGHTVFMLNDKSALYIPTAECNPAVADRCIFYFLPIGWASKDILAIGEDAFELAYDNKGNVQVYGFDYGTLWTSSCTDAQVENFGPASDKKSCGGRIVAKGFKKDY